MADNNEKIDQLLDKLEVLLRRQDDFSREINTLRIEINSLKTAEPAQPTETLRREPDRAGTELVFEAPKEATETSRPYTPPQTRQQTPPQAVAPTEAAPRGKSNLEKFIGENLINKIGIAITIIGVAIGAKYTIDNDLISPLTRIILGYVAGLVLLGFGIRLKRQYESYSAVLVSGAMAIMYFITYAAYSFYGLMPQVFAFVVMVVFTVFTVIAAISYNRQVIALIGLVGAYVVPFLLDDGAQNAAGLFTYMAIINIGILAIAFRKYWKPLYYAAFGLTWLIYLSWYVPTYQPTEHFGLALAFLTLFFAIFYLTFLAYKLLQKEKFVAADIVLLLANSFIFYGIGYLILEQHPTGQQLLGLFTLGNALVHFAVSVVIYRKELADRHLFYLVSSLVLVFITMAIPVQLDGNWVTLLWAGEAALLFWIGRTKQVPFYEKLSYPLMILAFFSLVQDWEAAYHVYSPGYPETRITPLLNIHFLTSGLFILAFGFINWLHRDKHYTSALASQRRTSELVSFALPAVLLFTLYYAFHLEISNYWSQLYVDSALEVRAENGESTEYYQNYDLMRFRAIWLINYSLLFVSLLSFVNFRVFRNQQLGLINLGLTVVAIASFLLEGLYELGELGESYRAQTLSQYYQRGVFHIGIRYVSFAFVALALVACHRYIRQEFIKRDFKTAFDLLLHVTILAIASSEFILWMSMAQSEQSYKLGLSILWGVYSLFLIALGIWKKNKPLRVGAIALFGVTLLKLLFYDIAHLDTIAKTIVFVSLGVLLLIISFLYNKYKHIISDEAED